jgi:hypothetical protein
MRGRGELLAHNSAWVFRTDADGRFRFALKLGDAKCGDGSNGRSHAAADLATNNKVMLQAGASSGCLVRDGQPASGRTDLKPIFDYNNQRPWVNHGTRMDEERAAHIEHIPPGEWYLTTRLKTGYGGWTSRQHRFTAKPENWSRQARFRRPMAEPPRVALRRGIRPVGITLAHT